MTRKSPASGSSPKLGERIRDVEHGPDGWIYLLTDGGKLIQIRD